MCFQNNLLYLAKTIPDITAFIRGNPRASVPEKFKNITDNIIKSLPGNNFQHFDEMFSWRAVSDILSDILEPQHAFFINYEDAGNSFVTKHTIKFHDFAFAIN